MKNSWYFSLQFQSLNVFFAFRFWFVGLKYVESGREPTARFYTKNKFDNRGGGMSGICVGFVCFCWRDSPNRRGSGSLLFWKVRRFFPKIQGELGSRKFFWGLFYKKKPGLTPGLLVAAPLCAYYERYSLAWHRRLFRKTHSSPADTRCQNFVSMVMQRWFLKTQSLVRPTRICSQSRTVRSQTLLLCTVHCPHRSVERGGETRISQPKLYAFWLFLNKKTQSAFFR